MKLRIDDRSARAMPIYRARESEIPPELSLVVMGRLHKRALGIATGLVLGALIFVLTAVTVLMDLEPFPISLLSEFIPGYAVTWAGAFAGSFWGGFMGFVFGWFAAFCRNFVLATWLFFARARAQIAASRDFLDHI